MNIFHTMKTKIGTSIVVAGFSVLSLTTTGVAASKLWTNYQAKSPAGEPLEIKQTRPSTPRPTPKPVFPMASLPPTALKAATNACIITLSGQQYDVTSLRSTHSGGDIFSCGTDMTQRYISKHGSNLSRMQQYLSTNITGTQQPTTNTNSANYKADDDREDDHDEDESSEEQDRYVDGKTYETKDNDD